VSALAIALTPRAARQVQTALAWWRENRPVAPRMLEQELRDMLSVAAAAPTRGVLVRDTRLPNVRRILLHRTRYHVYYRVDAAGERLEILALWHARRPPPSL